MELLNKKRPRAVKTDCGLFVCCEDLFAAFSKRILRTKQLFGSKTGFKQSYFFRDRAILAFSTTRSAVMPKRFLR